MASRTITVVGLGPGDPGLRTLAAQRTLDDAARIVLRTAIHPGVDDIAADPRTIACDDLYGAHASFDEVYAAVVDRVLDEARDRDVVYAVPGHPSFGERTIPLLRARAAPADIDVAVVAGLSAVDAVAMAIGSDPMAEQVQVLDAVEIALVAEREPFGQGALGVDPARPVLVTQVYSRAMASAAKLFLTDVFGDEHEAMVVTAASVPGEERREAVPLHRLDHVPVDHLTSVWVPAADPIMSSQAAATLARIVARLRAPGGCPWDREQDHRSLRQSVIDEAYEVVDAIDAEDAGNLAEELGDLLLLVHMHAQIAEEAGDFTLVDIFDHVNRKLVRRHPHVFADVSATTPDQVLKTWNQVKADERAAKGDGAEPIETPNPVDRWPRSMPAMLKAERVIARGIKGSTPRQGEMAADLAVTPDHVGSELIAILERAARAGIDAEGALDRALRDRYSATE